MYVSVDSVLVFGLAMYLCTLLLKISSLLVCELFYSCLCMTLLGWPQHGPNGLPPSLAHQNRAVMESCRIPELCRHGNHFRGSIFWEVLNGVGVDGVGGIFPFFLLFFFFRFSSFFFAFRLFSWNKGKRLQFTGKMGNFTPTPSAPTPFGTSRIF